MIWLEGDGLEGGDLVESIKKVVAQRGKFREERNREHAAMLMLSRVQVETAEKATAANARTAAAERSLAFERAKVRAQRSEIEALRTHVTPDQEDRCRNAAREYGLELCKAIGPGPVPPSLFAVVEECETADGPASSIELLMLEAGRTLVPTGTGPSFFRVTFVGPETDARGFFEDSKNRGSS